MVAGQSSGESKTSKKKKKHFKGDRSACGAGAFNPAEKGKRERGEYKIVRERENKMCGKG